MNDDRRPWSPAEVEEKLREARERSDEALAALRGYGVAAGRTEWDYREALARCQVMSEGRNAEERHANAIIALVELRSRIPGWEGMHPGLARDLARNAYSDARVVCAAVSDDIGALRSMLKSSRDGTA
jgi:hypothetical protein